MAKTGDVPHLENEVVSPTTSEASSRARRVKRSRQLSVADLDSRLVEAKYAVRGTVVQRAAELKADLAKGKKLPFDQLILCNIGNPQAVKQKPITFYRQVAACMYLPEMREVAGRAKLAATGLFPADVIAQAQKYLEATGGSGVGAYTDSIGLRLVRKEVCEFIEKRDGYPANPDHIALTTGASEGVKRAINALVDGSSAGIMIPMPQYPLYSAALTMAGGQAVYYQLDEQKGWICPPDELERAYQDAISRGIDVRAIAVINPGNPVGAVLSEQAVAETVVFAVSRGLAILADEVYQLNIYAEGKAFHSTKKVLRMLKDGSMSPPPTCPAVWTDGFSEKLAIAQLISFHSTSKGLIGECGQRGGYMEMVGFSERTIGVFSKVAATSLSSNTIGQVFVGLMVTGPKEGDPSWELFQQETKAILGGLKRRAAQATEALNKTTGISSQPIEGAMYAFPTIALPAAMVQDCSRRGVAPDEQWCLDLMEQTGIVCVPGSGFGQKEGTFHARLTILPPDDVFGSMLEKLEAFQQTFYKKYSFEPPPRAK